MNPFSNWLVYFKFAIIAPLLSFEDVVFNIYAIAHFISWGLQHVCPAYFSLVMYQLWLCTIYSIRLIQSLHCSSTEAHTGLWLWTFVYISTLSNFKIQYFVVCSFIVYTSFIQIIQVLYFVQVSCWKDCDCIYSTVTN